MKQASKFLLGFLIISLFVTICYIPEVKATSSFGETNKGTSTGLIPAHYIRASWFPCPETGTANSITVYLTQSSVLATFKCAIYRKSDKALIGSTEEWTITSGFDNWHTFAITSGGSLTATDYWLCVWANLGEGAASCILAKETETDKGGTDPETYNGWPEPLDPTITDARYSLYCTYTPTAAGEYSEEFTETVSISASLYLWQAIFHKYTETITITTNLYSWREKASFYTETTTVTEQLNKWIELARFFTETIIITETSSFAMEILIVITEFVETITVDASLFLWREIQHEFYETITLTASLQALAEEFISFMEFPELIRFDADLYLTLPIIPTPEIEITTFGTVAFVIAIIALALGIVALRKRE